MTQQPEPVGIAWGAFCDLAFLDEWRRLCVLGITPSITVQALPVSIQRICFVAALIGPEGLQIQAGMTLTTPGGEEAQVASKSMEARHGFLFITFHGLSLPEPGTYVLRISLESELAIQANLMVKAAPGAPQPQVH